MKDIVSVGFLTIKDTSLDISDVEKEILQMCATKEQVFFFFFFFFFFLFFFFFFFGSYSHPIFLYFVRAGGSFISIYFNVFCCCFQDSREDC